MKSFLSSLLFAACCLFLLLQKEQSLCVDAFAVGPPSSLGGAALAKSSSSSTRLNFFGGPKDDGSPGDYVCKDCGYVFTKGPKAWAALPDDWSCPPCGAPKYRFKKVPKGSESGKVKVKKSWF